MKLAMEMRTVHTFLTVAATLSFTRAAEALDYAQSSVTAQIQALEAELGVPLFERLGRRVTLSMAGRRLLPYAEQLLRVAEEAQAAVPDVREPGGTLTVGAPESQCAYRLPPVLSRFRSRFPAVQLVFRPGRDMELPHLVSEGKVDVGILWAPPVHMPNLIVEPLSREPLLVLAHPSHHLTRLSTVYPIQLQGETLLLTEADGIYRGLFQETLATAGVRSASVLEFTSVEAIKQCAMAGMGIAFLPAITAEAELMQGRLAALRWSAGEYGLTTQMAWHRDKWLSPALREFVDLCRTMLAPVHVTRHIDAPRLASAEGVPTPRAGARRPPDPEQAPTQGGTERAEPATRRERQAWVLKHLGTAGAISPRVYARAMAVSVDTALIDLRELMARGLLRAEGTTKDRRYLLRADPA